MPSCSPQHRFRTVLLDLDGTLVDAFTTIHRAYCHTLPQFGLPAPTAAQVRRAVGGGLEKAMSHFLPPELIEEGCRIHVAFAEKIQLEDPVVYPGGRELVTGLRTQGVRTAVLTNKIGEHARAILAHLGLAPHLDLILGARDCPWRKPAPEFTAEALGRLSATAATTCMVGDSPFDIATAANAGMASFCVCTGTHTEAELNAAGATSVFSDLTALGRTIFGLPGT
jgi:phosphoglycolate phosphatase